MNGGTPARSATRASATGGVVSHEEDTRSRTHTLAASLVRVAHMHRAVLSWHREILTPPFVIDPRRFGWCCRANGGIAGTIHAGARLCHGGGRTAQSRQESSAVDAIDSTCVAPLNVLARAVSSDRCTRGEGLMKSALLRILNGARRRLRLKAKPEGHDTDIEIVHDAFIARVLTSGAPADSLDEDRR